MYQSIEQFLLAPFGEPEPKSNEFERKYKELVSHKRIHIYGYMEHEKTYWLHLKVGSDTNKNQDYDVVLLFFTDDPDIEAGKSFRNYYVKFFSNSPSFIYNYAALYKQEGFLIEELFNKLDPEFADKMPEKRNPWNKMSYDKSIYSSCRFIQDNRLSVFTKNGLATFRYRKKFDKFFRDIKDFSEIKLSQDMFKINRDIKKKSEEKKQEKKKKPRKSVGEGVKLTQATRSTRTDQKQSSITIKKAKGGKGKKGKTAPTLHAGRKKN